MAINITSIDEAIEDNGLKILVHGLSGAGKTMLCASTGSPTLILNAEGGLLSIRGAPSYIKVAKVSCFEDLEEVIDMLEMDERNGERKFDWVALDSISDVAEAVLKNELEACADPRKSYPAFQSKVDSLIKAFRDLRNYHVIMTAKQDMTKDDYTGITLRSPHMPGNKLGPAVPYLYDLVLALRVDKDEDGNDYRTLQTSRDVMYEAKDRSGELKMFEPPNLKKILKKTHPDFVPLPKNPGGKNKVKGDPVEELSADEGEEAVVYWYHNDSNSFGQCKAEEFEGLCDDAPGGLVEVTKEEFESEDIKSKD